MPLGSFINSHPLTSPSQRRKITQSRLYRT
jgi:hypothetical protein